MDVQKTQETITHHLPALKASFQSGERASNSVGDELVSGSQVKKGSCCCSIFHSIYGVFCSIGNAIVSLVQWICCCGKDKQNDAGSASSSGVAASSEPVQSQPIAPAREINLAEARDKWNRLLVSFREARQAGGNEGAEPLQVVWPRQFDQLSAADQTTLLKGFVRMCAPKEIEKGQEAGYVATEQEITAWVEKSYPADAEGRNTKLIAQRFVRNLMIHQGKDPLLDEGGVPTIIEDIVAELDRRADLEQRG